MVGLEALGHPGEPLAPQVSKQPADIARGEDAAKHLMMLAEVAADRPQALRQGHVHTAADLNLFRRNTEVVASTAMFFQITPREDRRDVRLIRGLVVAEACVAV